MDFGYHEFYLKGNKFSVFVTSGKFITVTQRRWLSGGAFGSQGRTNTQAWFHNVSKENRQLAIKTFKLLQAEVSA
jgi:hypothetical protein